MNLFITGVLGIVGEKSMKPKQQYEYECICGYVWIDSICKECPMCGEQADITGEPYESLAPEKFDRK